MSRASGWQESCSTADLSQSTCGCANSSCRPAFTTRTAFSHSHSDPVLSDRSPQSAAASSTGKERPDPGSLSPGGAPSPSLPGCCFPLAFMRLTTSMSQGFPTGFLHIQVLPFVFWHLRDVVPVWGEWPTHSSLDLDCVTPSHFYSLCILIQFMEKSQDPVEGRAPKWQHKPILSIITNICVGFSLSHRKLPVSTYNLRLHVFANEENDAA